MRYHVLASDYDGTLARGGQVDKPTMDSLHRLRESGRIPILVTGRLLHDLLNVFPHPEIFERIVAENGALVFNPADRKETVLAEPPSDRLASLLRRQGVPLSVGRAIIATTTPHETAVLEAVRELGLELQVIFNKGAVMVLPTGINKASGLQFALTETGFSPHSAVAIGDAENDQAFMELCECSAAVANALPAVKERADLITNGDHGAGVAELIDRLVATDLAELEPLQRRHPHDQAR